MVFVFVAASAHELVVVYGLATVLYFVVVYAVGRVIATEEPAAVDEMYPYCNNILLLKLVANSYIMYWHIRRDTATKTYF